MKAADPPRRLEARPGLPHRVVILQVADADGIIDVFEYEPGPSRLIIGIGAEILRPEVRELLKDHAVDIRLVGDISPVAERFVPEARSVFHEYAPLPSVRHEACNDLDRTSKPLNSTHAYLSY